MERSVLDKKSTRVLNFPLTVNQQLWLVFLLPSVIETTFYIVDLATDLAIGIEFLSKKDIWVGSATLLITYSAPLVCYITHIVNPPPGNEIKALVAWFMVETGAFLLYPIRPIQCFAERLFWSIEATRLEDPKREDALKAYEATRHFKIEHYLFLQGLIHAGPQAIFQTVLLVSGYTDNPHIEKMQVLSIVTSLMSLSLVTTSYQRYETQAKGGRSRVWNVDQDTVDGEEPTVLLASGTSGNGLPVRRRWTKVMDEDNPIGKVSSLPVLVSVPAWKDSGSSDCSLVSPADCFGSLRWTLLFHAPLHFTITRLQVFNPTENPHVLRIHILSGRGWHTVPQILLILRPVFHL
uniref:XK-related protein n=1 Tax=Lygus hesperus TaxID=30085 RepID=A0A0K8SCK5_LYGHE